MKNLTTWSPFNDLWSLQDEVNRLFRTAGNDSGVWAPLVDVSEDKESVKINAELPGLKKGDVKIDYEEGVLSIRGERKFDEETKEDNYYRIERSYGSFCRNFTLPKSVDAEKIKARMNEGVLEILIPKKEEAKPKEISIEVS